MSCWACTPRAGAVRLQERDGSRAGDFPWQVSASLSALASLLPLQTGFL